MFLPFPLPFLFVLEEQGLMTRKSPKIPILGQPVKILTPNIPMGNKQRFKTCGKGGDWILISWEDINTGIVAKHKKVRRKMSCG